MYGPSLGFIVVAKAFLNELDCFFLGGGTVADVRKDDFDLLDSPDDEFARLEPGLQDFAGIAGLGAAIDWLGKRSPGKSRTPASIKLVFARSLFESLSSNTRLKVLNAGPAPIVSFYNEHVDAHRLALYLSAQNIMVRSGYFCCHYYLAKLYAAPSAVAPRISIGLQNTAARGNAMPPT